MPTEPSDFIWYELLTNDVDAAAKFYGAVVGWTVQRGATPGMDYRMWMMGEAAVGGFMAIPAEAATGGMRPSWLGYVNVPDVDQSVAAIKAAGGELCMPATDVPGVGRMAMVTDPQGAAFYVMTPIGTGKSVSYSPTQAGHGGWHELHARDWRAAFEFYGTQLGWRQSESLDMGPMGTYLLFNAGAEAIGGMMTSPDFATPMWLYYFNVDDIEKAKARVTTAGGVLLQGPHQVPGGGWMLQGRDPQGAMFALFSAPAA